MARNRSIARLDVRLLLVLFALIPAQVVPAGAAVTVKVSGGAAPEVNVEGSAAVTAADIAVMQGSFAAIAGNTLELQAKEPGSEKLSTIVSGTIIKSQLTQSELKGYVAFLSGPSLIAIDDPAVDEMIEIEGGQLVSGHITQMSSEAIKIGEQEVPVAKITRLCSPRIFEFVCPFVKVASSDAFEGSAPQITLKPTTSPYQGKKNESEVGANQKRCCNFAKVAPVVTAKKKGGFHIPIIIVVP